MSSLVRRRNKGKVDNYGSKFEKSKEVHSFALRESLLVFGFIQKVKEKVAWT